MTETKTALEQIKAMGPREIKTHALIGDASAIMSYDLENVRVMFRGQPTTFSHKSMRVLSGRYYVSQVTLEARKGRDPSHLFAQKPQTDRER